MYELAKRNQHFLLGQMLAIQTLTAAAQMQTSLKDRMEIYSNAVTVADTATGFSPDVPEPAMLLASTCRELALLHNIAARMQKPDSAAAAAERSQSAELSRRARAVLKSGKSELQKIPRPQME